MKCPSPKYGGKQENPYDYLRIDESFTTLIKRIRRKGFCTVNSCSGVHRDHYESRMEYINENYKNGTVIIKIMELSAKKISSLLKKYGYGFPRMEFEDIKKLIDMTRESFILHDLIEDSAEKNGFDIEWAIFPDEKVIVAIIKPLEKNKMLDDEIIRKWEKFSRDLRAVKK